MMTPPLAAAACLISSGLCAAPGMDTVHSAATSTTQRNILGIIVPPVRVLINNGLTLLQQQDAPVRMHRDEHVGAGIEHVRGRCVYFKLLASDVEPVDDGIAEECRKS